MLFRTSQKVFLHVDCDSFFASCEVLRHPYLKGKMVCVGGDIIVASSYEAKALWVKVGTPIWEAKRILGNHAYFFWVDLNFYSQISHQLMSYLRKQTLKVEPFSIDEAFCEISGLPELYKKTTYEYVESLQKNILKVIGIPVSIGVANTRIKAKIFSKIRKPYGIFIGFEKSFIAEYYSKIPVKDIPFIGKQSQEKLKYKCQSISDYISLWFWKIKNLIGKTGTDLWLELLWVDMFIVKKSSQAKSIHRTRSFNHQLSNNKGFIFQQLLNNFERAIDELYEWDNQTKHVAIMFRDKQFRVEVYDYKLPEYTHQRKVLLDIVIMLFEKYFDSWKVYRSTGVYLYEFRSYLPQQLNIFDSSLRWAQHDYQLIKKIHEINTKFWGKKISFWNRLWETGKKSTYRICN